MKRKSDAKPRRARDVPYVTRFQRAKSRMRGTVMSQEASVTGALRMRDYASSGRLSGVVFGATGSQGGISHDPALQVAWRIRNALSPNQTRRPDCLVYDKDGKLIARIDGETRQRTEV